MSFELVGHQDVHPRVLFELRTSLSGFLRPEVALRIESACRVKALGRPRVALARTARPCGVWCVRSGAGASHMLSIPYELFRNKVVPSVELRESLWKSADVLTGQKPNVVLLWRCWLLPRSDTRS